MASGAIFHVESAQRLLNVGEPLVLEYLCGGDRPSWNAVMSLAQAGQSVTVLHRGAAAQVRAAAADWPHVDVVEIPETQLHFHEIAFPEACNCLLIDEYGWQRDFLRDTLAAGAGPAIVVARDGAEAIPARQAKYALLMQMNYHFAGLSGEHSLWTRGRQQREQGPLLMTELPAAVQALPAAAGGSVQLDTTHLNDSLTPPGEILRISARASFGISGWSLILPDEPPALQVFASARHDETGVTEFMALAQEARADVAAHFGNQKLLMTGFRGDLSPLLHRIGTHTLRLIQTDGVNRYESGPLFQFALALQPYELSARAGLANRYLRGNGIEIGALQKPAQLSAACQVRYIDRMTLDKLLEHYPEMAGIPVQAPDIVDDGQLLEHIAEDSQDFAIANHFLEHCQDPIRSLHNILRVVKVGGILYLAVPDKRHTFDLRRPVTPYSVLKSAYVSGQRAGRAELFYEWCHLVYQLPPEQAAMRAKRLMEEDYSIHYNVWATGDLLHFLMSTRHDFQSPFELVAAVSSENETIVLLERTAGRLPI